MTQQWSAPAVDLVHSSQRTEMGLCVNHNSPTVALLLTRQESHEMDRC
jgi:hypothetical protein